MRDLNHEKMRLPGGQISGCPNSRICRLCGVYFEEGIQGVCPTKVVRFVAPQLFEMDEEGDDDDPREQVARLVMRMDEYLADPTKVRFPFSLDYAEVDLSRTALASSVVKHPPRWVRLEDLPKGAIFETQDGIKAVKTEYHYNSGVCMAVLLASGEYAHFPEKNDTLVREIDIE